MTHSGGNTLTRGGISRRVSDEVGRGLFWAQGLERGLNLCEGKGEVVVGTLSYIS